MNNKLFKVIWWGSVMIIVVGTIAFIVLVVAAVDHIGSVDWAKEIGSFIGRMEAAKELEQAQ